MATILNIVIDLSKYGNVVNIENSKIVGVVDLIPNND